tara:strand:+ start:9424 stop:9648 length:225 start_codon:yes stop_codon:yes gene_type:complete
MAIERHRQAARAAYSQSAMNEAMTQIGLALEQHNSVRHHYFQGRIFEAKKRVDDAVLAIYRVAIRFDDKYKQAR